MRTLTYIFAALLSVGVTPIYAQDRKTEAKESSFQNTSFYETGSFRQRFCGKKPKNIILMIGDGMGLAQIYAGMTANKGTLF